MTEVLLIRHAATDHVGRVLTGRMPGVGLSGDGRVEAAVLAERLSGTRLDGLQASPRERAAETAEAIASGRPLVVETNADLDEIDFGAFTGRGFAALDGDPDWRLWNDQRATARAPGGETMAEAAQRVMRAIGLAAERFDGGLVALVSHADLIKAAVLRVLGLGFEALPRFEIAPASVTRLGVERWGLRLLSLNGRE